MLLLISALVIMGITYLFIITEWINKMTAALLGSFAFVLGGIMTQEQAFSHIDWNVVFLLIGMMIVVSILKETGVFQFVAIKTAKAAGGRPVWILILLFLVTTLISAFLDNVTTVMLLIPVVLLITQELKISPYPFIINTAIASNIGGTATLIGDPPNILIGSKTSLTFMDFIFNLTPPVLIIIFISIAMIWVFYNKRIKVSNRDRAKLMEYNERNMIKDTKLLRCSLYAITAMLALFSFQGVLGLESATIAMSTALVMLIFSNRRYVEKILNDVDWVTVFFFMGLFMIVGGLSETGILKTIAQWIVRVADNDRRLISLAIVWVSGIASAAMGSVPLVTTMIPVIRDVNLALGRDSGDVLWWALALGSCLGGLGTPVGAASNIVSIGIANRNGFRIKYRQFLKYGLIYMTLSLGVSSAYILIRYF